MQTTFTDIDRSIPPPETGLIFPALPRVRYVRLRNGIPVYLVPFGNQPVCEIKIVFRSGHAYEGIPGVDDCTLRMLTDGTYNFTALQIAEKLDFWGALAKN